MKKNLLLVWICLLFGFISSAQDYALSFNGTSHYVDIGSGPTGVKSIEFWINPSTTTEYIIDLNGTAFISLNAGTLSATGFSSPIIYVNGIASTTLDANTWSHVAITTASGINASDMDLGRQGSNYFGGFLDEVRLWSDVRSLSEIRSCMYKDVSSESNLLAYYAMTDGVNGTLTDNSSNSYNGTINGSSWITSAALAGPRNSLELDGYNDYISVPHSASLAIGSNPYSLEVWLTTADSAQKASIVYKRTTINYEVVGLMISDGNNPRCCPGSGKKITFSFGQAGGSNFRAVSTVNDIIDGNAHHIAVSVNPTTSTINLYIDGVLQNVSTQSIGNFPTISQTPNYTFGQNNSNTEYLSGKLDEVRIWNKVLTAHEIRKNMCRTLTGDESGLVAYYRFDQESAASGSTTLYDITSNGNHGTLTNMDASSDWITSINYNTWIGAVSTNWTTDANWSRGVQPTSRDNVGIYNYTNGNNPIIASSSTANASILMIAPSASLEIESSASLNIDNNGKLLLCSDENTTASIDDENASGGISFGTNANALVERFVDGGSGGYLHYVSPPVSNAKGSDLLDSDLGNYNVYYYHTDNTSFTRVFGSDPLNEGQGYYVAYNDNKTIEFEGTLNQSTITYSPIWYTSGFHLIGNPYPSRISASLFHADSDNDDLDGSVYYWADDHTAGSDYSSDDYATWNSGGAVAPQGGSSVGAPNAFIESGQGFFVNATSSTKGSITLKNSFRSNDDPTAFYTPAVEMQRIWLTATSPHGIKNSILIGFSEITTEERDVDYDAEKLRGNAHIAFYSLMPSDELGYVIQFLPKLENSRTVPLGLFAGEQGDYTISIESLDHFSEDYNIYIVDSKTGNTLDLRSSVYSFSTDKGDFDNRFSLYLVKKSVSMENDHEFNVLVDSKDKSIIINDPQLQVARVIIYDVSGKLQYDSKPNKSTIHCINLNVNSGVYFVNLIGTKHPTTKKVVIK
jgi:hypothetical protein